VGKSAFLFPGQGAQVVGMGRALASELPAARNVYDRANKVLGYDLAEICFEGPADKLNSTVYSQPALFVTSVAAIEKLNHDTPGLVDQCNATAGLSLGEYTALFFAACMTFDDALRVVQRRGEAMQAAADLTAGGMVSILGMELADVEKLCEDCRQGDEVLQVANLLCPGNIAISGDVAALERASIEAPKRGAMRAIRLSVAGAFHTRLMQPAVEQLQDALANVEIHAPRIPVFFNVDAKPHYEPEEIRALLAKQVISPVLWETSMREMLGEDIDQFHEIGPGKVLRGLLKRIDRKIPCDGVLE
jgi:[acyl-carrier-protein] S-malonyltransferase